MDWEIIDQYHERAMIPGGWLVKTFSDITYEENFSVAICFVPDEFHVWKIKKD